MKEDDVALYRAQSFGGTVGIGERPALCIVDFVNGFMDPTMFGGGNIREAVAEDGSDDCAFVRKVPALAALTEHAPGAQIVADLTPAAGEAILRKTQPSAFFGTFYAEALRRRGVDTLIVAGCTTSGCVRATVVDAMSYNFRTIVARDCVGDRSLAAHDANLFDMEQKYADVMKSEAIIAALRTPAPAA